MKNIVVDGFTYSISDPTVTATVQIISPPSFTTLIDGKGVHVNGCSAIVSNVFTPDASIPDPTPHMISFNSTATKVYVDEDRVLLQGDTSDFVLATPQIPGSPPVPSPISFNLEIVFANQVFVRGE